MADIAQMRPNICAYCNVGYAALQYTLEDALAQGWDIVDLAGDLATKESLEKTISDHMPMFFNGFGHGSSNVFTGQGLASVLVAGINEHILKGMIVYLLSCLTAQVLGPAIIEAGGLSYMGYDIPWTWLQEVFPDPFEDVYAKGFYDSSNIIPLTIQHGQTTGEAYQAGIDKYDEWIAYWEQSDNPYAAECIHWLMWDRDGLVLLGRNDVTLKKIVLTILSTPIDVPFRIDNIQYSTPWAQKTLAYTKHLSVVPSLEVGGVCYRFKQWEDGSTNPDRVIDVVDDMTITATYEIVPCHILSVNTDPMSSEFNLDGWFIYATPWNGKLAASLHTVTVPNEIWTGGLLYEFVNWEDGSTDLTRTLNLTGDLVVMAFYRQLELDTFGMTETGIHDGRTWFNYGLRYLSGCRVSAPESGLLRKISLYARAEEPAWCKAGIYLGIGSASYGNMPGPLLAETEPIQIGMTLKWHDFFFTTPFDLSLIPTVFPDRPVWLIFWSPVTTSSVLKIDTELRTVAWYMITGYGGAVIPGLPEDFREARGFPPLSLRVSLYGTYSFVPSPSAFTLTVDSEPTGVPFNINGTPQTTLYTETLLEGTYTIQMPADLTINGETYFFSRWENGSTDPTRTIYLASDMDLKAIYEVPPPPECSVDADCEELYGPGYICVDGKCVEAPPPEPNLVVDSSPRGIPFTIEAT